MDLLVLLGFKAVATLVMLYLIKMSKPKGGEPDER